MHYQSNSNKPKTLSALNSIIIYFSETDLCWSEKVPDWWALQIWCELKDMWWDLKINFAHFLKLSLQSNLLFLKTPLVYRAMSSSSCSVLLLSIQLLHINSHFICRSSYFSLSFLSSIFYSQGQKCGRHLQFLHKSTFCIK